MAISRSTPPVPVQAHLFQDSAPKHPSLLPVGPALYLWKAPSMPPIGPPLLLLQPMPVLGFSSSRPQPTSWSPMSVLVLPPIQPGPLPRSMFSDTPDAHWWNLDLFGQPG